jgi:hypothetical protein
VATVKESQYREHRWQDFDGWFTTKEWLVTGTPHSACIQMISEISLVETREKNNEQYYRNSISTGCAEAPAKVVTGRLFFRGKRWRADSFRTILATRVEVTPMLPLPK